MRKIQTRKHNSLWKLLSVGTLLLSVSSCGTIQDAPDIEVCIFAGGVAYCHVPGSPEPIVRAPSEMDSYWSTNQDDIKALMLWCSERGAK